VRFRLSGGRANARLVAIDKVAGRGSLPVSRRYTSSRPLEADYILERTVLGCGLNGPVRLATGRLDGKQYAVKSFDKRGKHVEEFRSEAEIYLSLDHPHVAHLEMVYEAERKLHLVMEFMQGGELYDRLAERRRCTEATAADAMHQMLLAVAYLHTHGIAHRDLKLENFMYERKDTNHLKLIDFGFAKHTEQSEKMSQACGSLHYVAPEVLGRSYTEKADMWSMGVIAYMLLTGSAAFSGRDSDIMKKIKAGKVAYNSYFNRLSRAGQDFVKSLLVVDPANRLSAQQALEHPWIADRLQSFPAALDTGILESVRSFSRASQFQRTVLSMMAWSLSAGDRSELRKQFLQIDADKNGTISLKEFTDVMANRFNVCGREAEAMFKCIDTDDNNEIEYNEFLAVAVQHEPEHQDLLRQTFARFDADGDGVITRCELRSTLGDTFSQDEVAGVLQAADTSGDGKLSFEEFLAFFTGAGDVACSRPQRDEGQSPPSTAETLSPAASEEKEQSAAEAIAHPPATAGPRPEATQDLLGAHEKAPVRRKAGAPSTPGCFPTLGSGGPLPVLLTSIQAGLRSGKPAA